MEEKVILQEAGVLVSTTRIVIGGTTYQLANITSVRKRRKMQEHGCLVVFLLLLGIVLGVSGIGLLSGESKGSGVLLLVLATVVVVALIRVGKPKLDYCAVIFSSSANELEALKSKDEPFIDRIVEAINRAFTERG